MNKRLTQQTQKRGSTAAGLRMLQSWRREPKRLIGQILLVIAFGFANIGCSGHGDEFKRTPGLLPFGFMDTPKSGSVAKGATLPVSGWALSEDGVASVCIYVDRNLRAVAELGEGRPDVARVFPQFRCATESGWSALLDVTELGAGSHLLVAQIRSRSGTAADLPAITIAVPSP